MGDEETELVLLPGRFTGVGDDEGGVQHKETRGSRNAECRQDSKNQWGSD